MRSEIARTRVEDGEEGLSPSPPPIGWELGQDHANRRREFAQFIRGGNGTVRRA